MRNYDYKRHIWVTVAMKGMSSNIIERVHCNGQSDRPCLQSFISFLAKEKEKRSCLKLRILSKLIKMLKFSRHTSRIGKREMIYT